MLLLSGLLLAGAQDLSSRREQFLPLTSDTLKLDTLMVLPGSLQLIADGVVISPQQYTLYPAQGFLIWRNRPNAKEIQVKYRVRYLPVSRVTALRSYSEYVRRESNKLLSPFVSSSPDREAEFFSSLKELQYNGNISRGLVMGSNQDVVLNSALNFQLSGEVGQGIFLTAAVTDNQVPFQPQGNSQNIQEFDRIFIELKKNEYSLRAGDFDIFQPEDAHFLRFSKKNRGLYYRGSTPLKKHTLKTAAAGGVSTGRFARNTLAIREGTQGPYKLFGSNGEPFIVIVAGTEEVFINGEKMIRGADQDYIIDYNTAEITFTPRRFITRDLRVIIEFEYTERYYLRSSVFASSGWETRRSQLRFHLFSEQDAPGQSYLQGLDDAKKIFLRNIGDRVTEAFYPAADSVPYDPNRLLYVRLDSLGYTIYRIATDTSASLYALSFQFRGEGQADYLPGPGLANGRVFYWVKPDTVQGRIIRRGTYSPDVFVPAPNLQQMMVLNGNIQLAKGHQLSGEAAVSYQDPNLFSPGQSNTHWGGAAKVGYSGKIPLQGDTVRGSRLEIQSDYEFVHRQFRVIERFRNLEFNRDWNNLRNDFRDEHLANLTLRFRKGKSNFIQAGLRHFSRSGGFQAWRGLLSADWRVQGFQLTSDQALTWQKDTLQQSLFYRPNLTLQYHISKASQVGIQASPEINALRSAQADTFLPAAFLWQNYKVFYRYTDQRDNQILLEGLIRAEHDGRGKIFAAPYLTAQQANAVLRWLSSPAQQIQLQFTYRHSVIRDPQRVQNEPRHFYTARLEHDAQTKKNAFTHKLFYEVYSGREQRIILNYQVSPTNQGNFVWRDINEDGIKQINEFVSTPYREDTSYVKVFLTAPEFAPVHVVSLQEAIQFNPVRLWDKKTGVLKFLSRFMVTATWQWVRKTVVSGIVRAENLFNPFPLSVSRDTAVAAQQISGRNVMYFNRLDPVWGMQVEVNYSRIRTLLNSGYESRSSQQYLMQGRWNFSTAWAWEQRYRFQRRQDQSDYLGTSAFDFSGHDTRTEISWMYRSLLRISGQYTFTFSRNTGREQALIHEAGTQLRWSKASKTMLSAAATAHIVSFQNSQVSNVQLEFAMLNGLRNGKNLTWNLTLDQHLTSSLILSVGYEGRYLGFEAGDGRKVTPIHTGRAELRAVF